MLVYMKRCFDPHIPNLSSQPLGTGMGPSCWQAEEAQGVPRWRSVEHNVVVPMAYGSQNETNETQEGANRCGPFLFPLPHPPPRL